ncbi:hypothetical protein MOK15_04395 [Sphingobium sp. BYY-5]|uniref:hypothetical protein n=1 Tax=Sphingobium sp. BYY-5 TaxID=2926400 RepID=UPI001FA6BC9F|nr:hypothetical protein [Sphingobium sp. BYY-5]MCI4589336.1 hypothetical protein [Sphingobium sp. BYY-5]
MKARFALISLVIFATIIVPLGIGAVQGLGLSKAADGNQTFPFARKYFGDVVGDDTEYRKMRDEFSGTGWGSFGNRAPGVSICQKLIIRSFNQQDELIGAALINQRSVVLDEIFDRPGIEAIEALPSPVTGALRACKYTIVAATCHIWSRRTIASAIKSALPSLQNEKRKWLVDNEAASCKVSAKFGLGTSLPYRR